MKKLILVLSLICFQIGLAQNDTIYVFGPGGPYPAFQKVADAFELEYDVKVELTRGPLPQWKEEAHQKADIIFSGSEHMMTSFANLFKDEIAEETIYPLYKRKSGLLVRKGNPKNIKSLKDLIKKDVQIMVVQGAGLTGMWEDMLGNLKKMEDFRNIRSKIKVFADNSGLAQKEWKENSGVDVWISWNIWQIANDDSADFIGLAKKYTIYRNTDVALTQKGKSNSNAKAFYEFVKSDKAKQIFKQKGWE